MEVLESFKSPTPLHAAAIFLLGALVSFLALLLRGRWRALGVRIEGIALYFVIYGRCLIGCWLL